MSQRHASSPAVRLLSWLLICSPIWAYLGELDSFGRLQGNDYYGIVELIRDGDGITRDPARWLTLKSNEHRATLPVLVYALNMKLTRGNNLGLSVFALLLLTLVLALLVGLLPADLRADPRARTVFGFALALFCYTPVAAHNVAMGFSGTIWFFANLFAVAAIAALARRSGGGSVWALWPVLLCGVLAAFCHSTHLMMWPALLAGGLFLRLGVRRFVFLVAGATLVAALFVLSYEPLSYHPVPNTRDPGSLLQYTAIYLGALFSTDLATARLVGSAGLAACALVLGLVVWVSRASRDLRADLAPWAMLQIYGLGNAAVTAVSRSGFGLAQAMSSRYASLAALFWIGLLTSLGVLLWRRRPASTPLRAATAALLLLATAGLAAGMFGRGSAVIERFAVRGSRHGVAALAIVNGIRDDRLLAEVVTPAPHQVWAVRDVLAASRQVPFDRGEPFRPGRRVDAGLLRDRPHPGVKGHVDRIVDVADDVVRLAGWAWGAEAEVTEVLLLDDRGEVRGEALLGVRRPDLARKIHRRALAAGWEGYALIGPQGGGLGAYVRIAGDSVLYPLGMGESVARRLRPAEAR